MPPPQTTVATLDTPAFACMERLDAVSRALMVLNVHAMSRPNTSRDFDYMGRASAYIWVSAALEMWIKRFVEGLVLEINAAEVPRDQLRVSLLTLANAKTFQSLSSINHPRDLKKWPQQIAILQSVLSPESAELSLQEDHWPTDGSTLHRGHLDAIWKVFGLNASAVPHPATYGFLVDLRENRTRAAHGEADAVSLGRQQAHADALRLVSRGEELITHMLDRGTEYLLGQDYRR